ncbi:MAG TPA: peroxidase-related enzyme [Acidimicrobiales bacterium]|nr:peroxidase-related enzyme [Acidimicrobiales bacterium]
MSERETRNQVGEEERISWFPVPDEADLPDDLQGLFRKARANLGFVPNVFRAYSYRPERLRAWFAHYKQLHVPTENLDAAEREMIAVAVSMANGCLYCLVAHGATLRDLLGDPVKADRITLDYRKADLTPKQRAMLDYAVKLTKAPLECSAADLTALERTGLTLEEVWDVAEVAAMYNFTNRMSSATGMLPNEEYSRLAR